MKNMSKKSIRIIVTVGMCLFVGICTYIITSSYYVRKLDGLNKSYKDEIEVMSLEYSNLEDTFDDTMLDVGNNNSKYESKIEELESENAELESDLKDLESGVYNMMNDENYEMTVHHDGKTIIYRQTGDGLFRDKTVQTIK